MKLFFIYLYTIFLFLNIASGLTESSGIYKWTDPETGAIHYSSSAPSKGAKATDLPRITRGEVKLPKVKNITCDKHGGVDCKAGSDSDGSAICADGFKDVSIRYKFACSSPKLEVSDISELSAAGGFSVFVRNSKSVDAKNPKLTFQTPFGQAIILKGPDVVEAFGVAEFTYDPQLSAEDSQQDSSRLSKKPDAGQIELSCENC